MRVPGDRALLGFYLGGALVAALTVGLPRAALGGPTVQVTRGPYLQMATPSSLIVRWRTDVASDSRVRFGLGPADLTEVQDDATVTTEHLVQLEGLQSDHPSTTTPWVPVPRPSRAPTTPPSFELLLSRESPRRSGSGSSAIRAPPRQTAQGAIDAQAVRDGFKTFNGGGRPTSG